MMKMLKYTFMAITMMIFMASCSNTPAPEDIVRGYLDSHNRHDIEKALSYYHENASFHVQGQPPITDLRKLEAWDAAISSNLVYESWEVKGDIMIVGTIIEKNNWFSHAGIAEIVYKPGTKITLKDGKIYRIEVATMTGASLSALNTMFEDFFQWTYENYPEKLNELMPGGIFDYNEKNAATWFHLMDAWQMTQEASQ